MWLADFGEKIQNVGDGKVNCSAGDCVQNLYYGTQLDAISEESIAGPEQLVEDQSAMPLLHTEVPSSLVLLEETGIESRPSSMEVAVSVQDVEIIDHPPQPAHNEIGAGNKFLELTPPPSSDWKIAKPINYPRPAHNMISGSKKFLELTPPLSSDQKSATRGKLSRSASLPALTRPGGLVNGSCRPIDSSSKEASKNVERNSKDVTSHLDDTRSRKVANNAFESDHANATLAAISKTLGSADTSEAILQAVAAIIEENKALKEQLCCQGAKDARNEQEQTMKEVGSGIACNIAHTSVKHDQFKEEEEGRRCGELEDIVEVQAGVEEAFIEAVKDETVYTEPSLTTESKNEQFTVKEQEKLMEENDENLIAGTADISLGDEDSGEGDDEIRGKWEDNESEDGGAFDEVVRDETVATELSLTIESGNDGTASEERGEFTKETKGENTGDAARLALEDIGFENEDGGGSEVEGAEDEDSEDGEFEDVEIWNEELEHEEDGSSEELTEILENKTDDGESFSEPIDAELTPTALTPTTIPERNDHPSIRSLASLSEEIEENFKAPAVTAKDQIQFASDQSLPSTPNTVSTNSEINAGKTFFNFCSPSCSPPARGPTALEQRLFGGKAPSDFGFSMAPKFRTNHNKSGEAINEIVVTPVTTTAAVSSPDDDIKDLSSEEEIEKHLDPAERQGSIDEVTADVDDQAQQHLDASPDSTPKNRDSNQSGDEAKTISFSSPFAFGSDSSLTAFSFSPSSSMSTIIEGTPSPAGTKSRTHVFSLDLEAFAEKSLKSEIEDEKIDPIIDDQISSENTNAFAESTESRSDVSEALTERCVDLESSVDEASTPKDEEDAGIDPARWSRLTEEVKMAEKMETSNTPAQILPHTPHQARSYLPTPSTTPSPSPRTPVSAPKKGNKRKTTKYGVTATQERNARRKQKKAKDRAKPSGEEEV